MSLIFADTFYFLALLNRNDAAHQKTRTVSEKLIYPILTTAWVLTEVADAMAVPKLRENFLSPMIEALQSDPHTTIVLPTQTLFDQGLTFYAERPDKDWSLTDCISFVVMGRGAGADRRSAIHGVQLLLKSHISAVRASPGLGAARGEGREETVRG